MPTRRQFCTLAAGGAATWTLGKVASFAAEPKLGQLRLARFRFDVTPPLGHSLCGGWIRAVEGVDDSLEALGFVLLGAGEPIVVCAVDWTGLLNSAHTQWAQTLAKAAGTTMDRVAVQCVHQHNAPFACLGAEKIVSAEKELPHIVDIDYFAACLERAKAAVASSLSEARPVTAIGHGQAVVDRVASNRRVARGEDGRVTKMRGSSCTDVELQQMPEGTIDSKLKTVAFYDGAEKIAACHYYATHPMSYYGDGRVSSDFVGLARKRRQEEQPSCLQIYFTGCAGDVSAGKYNDGSKPVRAALADRIYDGMVAAEASLTPAPLRTLRWRTVELQPKPRAGVSAEALAAMIADQTRSVVDRNRPAYRLSWLQRLQTEAPLVLSGLHLNDISMLHLPAECFVEYQLRAQRMALDRFVATAAYGDGGPWYIPTADEYESEGYEVSVAFCEPGIDRLLTAGIRSLLPDADV